ncbi:MULTISPECIES: class I SAM-dependent methyltransferase [Anoxynatronum]|uniref:Methyltransferase domain-containing protein n=2 Tax=Anoxynatronum TaxID=210622 RepID=A0AA45WYY0_9CLOT|nr:class I SAM-dependent methyltransferase [Anoxynatronum buryatiense]SMP71114.1 Methyltransferase domain-containing protein [Anoxynatronum buryatiense]
MRKTEALTEAIRHRWDHCASHYDEGYDHAVKSDAEKQLWMKLLRQLIGESPRNILDIGTGTGNLAFMLAELGYSVKGVDLSAELLAIARSKQPPHMGKVVFEQQDAQELSETTGDQYDVVISRNVLWTITDPEKALSEWHRVMKPGGIFVMIDANWFCPTLQQRLLKAMGTLLKSFQKNQQHEEQEEQTYDPHIMASLPLIGKNGVQIFTKLANNCGFKNVVQIPLKEVDRIMWQQMPLQKKLLNAYHRYVLLGKKQ